MPVLRAQERQKEQEGLHRQLQAALHRLQAAAQGAAALVAAAAPESAAAAAELKPVLQRHCVRVAGGPALDALLAVLQVWLRLAACHVPEEQCAALDPRGLRDHGITWSHGEAVPCCLPGFMPWLCGLEGGVGSVTPEGVAGRLVRAGLAAQLHIAVATCRANVLGCRQLARWMQLSAGCMQADHGTGESQTSLTAAERGTLLQALPKDILDPVRAAVDKAASTDAEVRQLPVILTAIPLASIRAVQWICAAFSHPPFALLRLAVSLAGLCSA